MEPRAFLVSTLRLFDALEGLVGLRLLGIVNATDELIDKYEEKIRNIEELKNALLQKAFAGELTHTPQEVSV